MRWDVVLGVTAYGLPAVAILTGAAMVYTHSTAEPLVHAVGLLSIAFGCLWGAITAAAHYWLVRNGLFVEAQKVAA